MAKNKDETKGTDAEGVAKAAPSTEDEFIKSGWSHYSKKEFYRAEADFQKALEQSPQNADTLYALAMTYQASGRQQDAIRTFEKTIQALQGEQDLDTVRAHMLTRLAQAHISRIKTGEWNMEM